MPEDRKNTERKPKRQMSPKQLANLTGKGRPKGVPNKMTGALKDMIMGALSQAGGQDYLARQAEENPGAFMTLVGKVLPLDVNANVNAVIGMPVITIPPPDGD